MLGILPPREPGGRSDREGHAWPAFPRPWEFLLLAALTLVSGACGSDVAPGGASARVLEDHPVRERLHLHSGRPLELLISDEAPSGPTDRLTVWRDRLVSAEQVTHVGRIEGQPDEVIGFILGGAILSDGGFILLDRAYHRLRRWNAAGEEPQTYGRAGRGPGEFFQPQTLAASPGDTIWVFDADLRLHEIPMDAPLTEAAPFTAHTVPFPRMWFCRAGRTSFAVVSDPGSGPTLVRWSGSPADTTHLGRFYDTDHPLILSAYNSGSIACSPDGGQVAALVSGLPLLRIWSENGEAWDIHLADMVPSRVSLYEDQSVGVGGFQRGQRVRHHLLRVHFLEEDILLLQVQEALRQDDVPVQQSPSSVVTVLAAGWRAGRIAGLRVTGIPEIAALGDRGFLTVTNDPFPQAAMWEFSR
jgi:hypothetical protein